MSYHGGPHDSISNQVFKQLSRMDKRARYKARGYRVRRKHISNPEHYKEGIAFNKANGLGLPSAFTKGFAGVPKKSRKKVTLPQLKFME